MALAKFTLTACTSNKSALVGLQPFSLMLNPETISLKHNIEYQSPKNNQENKKFVSLGEWSVQIPSIVLDTTGAIPKSEWPQGHDDILGMIDHLKNVTCTYNGNNHEPPVVKMHWGTLLFWTKLKSMDVKYTLFNNSGVPVRAEVSLDFGGFKTEKEDAAVKRMNSPDLTHLVEVQVGDSLPLMCERVYKDPSLYLQVAKVNNLTNFRNLKPGSKLYFPPIVD